MSRFQSIFSLEHQPKNNKLSLFCKNLGVQYALVCMIFSVWHLAIFKRVCINFNQVLGENMHALPFINFKRLCKNISLYGKKALQHIAVCYYLSFFIEYWED